MLTQIVLLLNHHIKKGKSCLHDGTVTMDFDLEPFLLGSGFRGPLHQRARR